MPTIVQLFLGTSEPESRDCHDPHSTDAVTSGEIGTVPGSRLGCSAFDC